MVVVVVEVAMTMMAVIVMILRRLVCVELCQV